jgi:hypothetical protein
MSQRIKHGEVVKGQHILYLNGLWAVVLEVTNLGGQIKLLVEVGEGIKARVVEVVVNALTMGVVLVP